MPAAKKKSRVNESGNYTKPTMRKNLFNKIIGFIGIRCVQNFCKINKNCDFLFR